MAGLDRVRSEAHGQHEHTAAGAEVHLARERDVAVLGPIVLPGQPLVPGQVLPTVGRPDITGRSLEPGGRAGQGQGLVVAVREQHRHSQMCAEPRGVVRPPIPQVRSQERVEMIVAQPPFERREAGDLEDRVLVGMGEDRLLDPIAPSPAGVDQAIEGDALDRMLDPVLGVHTLLREELVPVGDDQPEVAGTRLVDARIEDLSEDAVTDGEPDQARGIGGRA